MTSATADCSAVAPLTTPEDECLAPAGTHPTFALAGLASDNQQRTTSACAGRGGSLPHFSAVPYVLGTNGEVSVMYGSLYY